MSLINDTYFIGSLLIPVDGINSQIYIDEYEPKCLEKVLGYSLNKDFQEGLLIEPVPQIWQDLRDGKEFTYEGTLKKHEGIYKIIARYVFFYIVRNISNYVSDSGVKVNQTNNTLFSDMKKRTFPAWNEMSEMNLKLSEFISLNTDIYGNYTYNDLGKTNVLNI